ncbi:MAG: SRPBCC family protein [Vicinamibacteraceae bacterium]
MTKSIQREIVVPSSREEVWRELTDSAALAEWMYPNDFEPRVGHRFTFQVPPNPKAGFDGIVRCEVLVCTPPSSLAYSWTGGPVVNTRVTYQLEPDGDGTRLIFQHSGFDLSQPWGEPALKGAEFGWMKMLDALVEGLATARHE